MRNRLNSLRAAYMKEVNQLSVIKSTNARAERLRDSIAEIDNYLEVAPVYVEALSSILRITKDEYTKFQESRVSFIENSLAYILTILFPNEDFTPKLNYSVERNNIQCELIFIDGNGNTRYPRITEGGFMKDLVGFTSAIKVLELLGSKTFYIDEAFSRASQENKEKMGDIIKNYLDDGLQMIMISQSSECYHNLPRKEFYLLKENNECRIVKQLDIDMGVSNE